MSFTKDLNPIDKFKHSSSSRRCASWMTSCVADSLITWPLCCPLLLCSSAPICLYRYRYLSISIYIYRLHLNQFLQFHLQLAIARLQLANDKFASFLSSISTHFPARKTLSNVNLLCCSFVHRISFNRFQFLLLLNISDLSSFSFYIFYIFETKFGQKFTCN